MRMFSSAFKRDLLRSLELFISVVVVFVFAIALTYGEDWCKDHNRPLWMLKAMQGLSFLVFTADGIVVLVMVIKLIVTALRDLLNEIRK